MNSINNTPIAFKADEPAIFDYEKMKKIAERNPETYNSIIFNSYSCRRGISRKTNSVERVLSYPNNEELKNEHVYKKKMYRFGNDVFEEGFFEKVSVIGTDGKGNYYVRKSPGGEKKPLKNFQNFSEMLAFFREYKAKQEKVPSALKRFLKDLFSNNLHDIEVDMSAKNLQDIASHVKPVIKKINLKTAASCICAFIVNPLIAPLICNPIISGAISGIFIVSFFAQNNSMSKLKETEIYKEYKASLSEKTGMMQRAIKALQQPMRMIRK